jgi:ionotropic glutamate receptor
MLIQKESSIFAYKSMWNSIKTSSDELLFKSSFSGIRKVKTENYAFLCESKLIEYMAERDCELVQVGGLLDEKNYGFGTPASIFL